MIRKTSETRALAGNIVNEYADSQTSAYSTEYINDMNTYSTSEVNTGKKWIDGKPIYSKTITVNRTSGTSYTVEFDSAGNISTIINVVGMAKKGTANAWSFYRVSDDDQYRYYVNNYAKGVLNITVGNNFPSPTHTAHITMLYTKTTD